MTDLEKQLAVVYRSRETAAPSFDDTFEAATRRAERRSQAVRVGLPVAAAVAMAAIIVGQPEPPPGLVSEAELLGATSWTAPSDGLLPTHRFDIYRDLPDLIESTKSNGETL